MKKRLVHYSFWIPLLLFTAHQISQKLYSISTPFLDNYLDPFCFTSIVFPLLQLERKYIFKQKKITFYESLFYLLALSICCEYILPIVSAEFISDPYDIIAMCIGYTWFLTLQPESILLKEKQPISIF